MGHCKAIAERRSFPFLVLMHCYVTSAPLPGDWHAGGPPYPLAIFFTTDSLQVPMAAMPFSKRI